MKLIDPNELSSILIAKALEFGASLAGIANVEDLKKSPAFLMMPARPHIDRAGAVEYETGLPEGVVKWPGEAKSALVIAFTHPEEDRYRDCWLDSKNPPGNYQLIKINKMMKEFVELEYPQVTSYPMSYYVERGGIWLKDSAVAAGIGILGKNNLLVTKRFGPRVRLRALLLSEDLPSTGPILDWDPCKNCDMPCRSGCPQNAFSEIIYDPSDYDGLAMLPGREGSYSLASCDKQMQIDEANEDNSGVFIPDYGIAKSVVSYCRACEFSCKVGK